MFKPWLIVAGDFARLGGMDRANYELARFIAEKQSGEIHLVAHRVDEPLASMPDVVVHRVPRPVGRHLFGSWLLARQGRAVARRLKTNAERIIVNGGNCFWPGTNWVHYVHNAFRPKQSGMPMLYRIKNLLTHRVNNRAEKKSFTASKLIIANSLRTRDDVRTVLGDQVRPIEVVYLGIDASRFARASAAERVAARARLGLSTDAKVVLFLGAVGFDQRKGFDSAVQALQISVKQFNLDAQMVVIGGGQIRFWQRMVDSQGAGRIRLMGPRADVPDWMAATDVLISPTRYEAYGMAVQEAFCRGLPAIVSKSAGVSEHIPEELDELILPNPDNVADLAGRIATVLTNRARIQPLVDSLGDRLRLWTWDHMAARIVRLVEEQC